MSLPVRKPDPVFGLPTPLLFAHRGGAREIEESTRRGFAHAVGIGADVLELDVHALRDGGDSRRAIVVWHGPELSNVVIDTLPGKKVCWPGERTADENDIRKCDWQDLKECAWVAAPKLCEGEWRRRDLSAVIRCKECELLTLDEMLGLFPQHPVNIELKDSVRDSDLDQIISILDNHRGSRTILVVGLNPLRMGQFRKRCGGRYATGYSLLGVGGAIAGTWLPFNAMPDMHQQALQTTYSANLTPARLIQKVHDRGGAVHVFLTAFTKLAPAIDGTREPGQTFDPPPEAVLFEILDRGVDGIMTDRPSRGRQLIDAWLARPLPV